MRTQLWAGLALLALANLASAAEPVTGNPKVQSIDSIGFGPDGLLLIGDGKGSQLVAVHTGDAKAVSWEKAAVGDIKEAIGARLGTDAKGVEINRLVVNPTSKRAYLAVRKLAGKQDAVLTIGEGGKIEEFPLENVKHQRFALPTEADSPITKITDVTYADGRILLAVQAGKQFSSKIYTIDLRDDKAEPKFVSTETYHVAHGKWETNAPIRTVIPYKEGGKTYLVGAFTCTPIVKYSLDDLKPQTRVKGTSVIELGNGNQPLDMFVYQKDGKSYILMNHVRFFHEKNPVGPSKYWTAKIDHSLLGEESNVNEKAIRRVGQSAKESKTDRATVAEGYHGVVMMDRLGEDRALVIRTDDKGGYSLNVLPLP